MMALAAPRKLPAEAQRAADAEIDFLLDTAQIYSRLGDRKQALLRIDEAIRIFEHSPNVRRTELWLSQHAREFLELELYEEAGRLALAMHSDPAAFLQGNREHILAVTSRELAKQGNIQAVRMAAALADLNARRKQINDVVAELIMRERGKDVESALPEVKDALTRFGARLQVATWQRAQVQEPQPMLDLTLLIRNKLGLTDGALHRYMQLMDSATADLAGIRIDAERSAAGAALAKLAANAGEFYHARKSCLPCSSVDRVRADVAILAAASTRPSNVKPVRNP